MYVLFNQTITKNRRNGARGGRAFARNLRLRKLLAPPPPPQAPREGEPPETAHEASLLLDRQFPWLANAFVPKQKRHRPLAVAEQSLVLLLIPEPPPYQPLDS
jgi:hypothetical protein